MNKLSVYCIHQLMSGDPAFLRPEEEFTTRFCYDGGPGLKRSREIGLENPLPNSFVQEYATNAYDGVQVNINPSNAEGTFVQSTKTQRLKTI